MIREGGIVEAAMALREQAPQGWDNFVKAVQTYSAETSMAMVKAEPDRLVQAQGRAQGMQDFVTLLLNAPKVFEKAQNAARMPRSQPFRGWSMSNSQDPNRFASPVPPAVAQAAARAEELQRELNAENSPVEPPQPEPAPEHPPEPEGQPAPAAAPGNRDWERDFAAMKGRYERAEAEAKNLKDRLDGMEALLAKVQTTAPAPRPAPEQTFSKLVTPQEESDYGKEFLDVVGKRAKEELLPELAELKSTVEHLKGGMATVGTTIAKSAEERVYDALDGEVGTDWEQLNYDPGFKEWLQQSDPYAGRKRHDMLTEAFGRHDAQRVVKFFKGYLTEAAAVDPQTPRGAPSLTPTQPNGSANGKIPLETLCGSRQSRSRSVSKPCRKTRVHTCPDCTVLSRPDRREVEGP